MSIVDKCSRSVMTLRWDRREGEDIFLDYSPRYADEVSNYLNYLSDESYFRSLLKACGAVKP